MIYLIDFENVHEEGFASLGRLGDRDAVYCFFTKNVAKISMAALAGMRSGQLHFIEAESGKQSLDLALVSYLGYLIGTVPNEQCYEIVSNDNGFSKAADFWNKHRPGIRVRVRKTVDQAKLAAAAELKPARKGRASKSAKAVTAAAAAPSVETKPAAETRTNPAPEAKPAPAPAAKPTAAPAQKNAASAAADNTPAKEAAPAAAAKPAAEPKPAARPAPAKKEASAPKTVPAPETAEANAAPAVKEAPAARPAPEAVAALAAAGIEASVAEFLLTEAEKHREDKNIKQLVYRAVVKKYGQKKGTEIYNTAKKVAL